MPSEAQVTVATGELKVMQELNEARHAICQDYIASWPQ